MNDAKWIAALGRLAALNRAMVVAGHAQAVAPKSPLDHPRAPGVVRRTSIADIRPGRKVLFYPDVALSTAGADVTVLAPWTSYVLQDREVISGQNPFSDYALLKLLLQALDANKNSVSAS